MTKILTAVRAFTKNMVAKPVPRDPRIKVLTGGVRRYEGGGKQVNRRTP